MSQLTAKRRRLIWATPVKKTVVVKTKTPVKRTTKLTSKLPDWQQFARKLFDQQLWCWGQDILCKDGNLLLRYGFTKTPPPAKHKAVASLYCFENKQCTVILRGFGMIYGNQKHGYLFLDRSSLRAKWFPTIPTELWTIEDLWQHTRKTKVQPSNEAKQQLLICAIRWLKAYESWIVREIGVPWREQTLTTWQRCCCSGAEMTKSWQAILEELTAIQ
jgi:hypothetical protein